MGFFGVTLAYSIMMYGLVLLLVSFPGPFGVMDKFRSLLNWIHPQLGKLIACPYCTSTWIGAAMSALNYFFIPIAFTPFNMVFAGTGYVVAIILFDTFFTAGSVWLLHVLDEYLEAITKVDYIDE